MEPNEFVLNRDVTKEECPWLDATVSKGTTVYRYRGFTYGCISHRGVAVTLEPDGAFMELPRLALEARP